MRNYRLQPTDKQGKPVLDTDWGLVCEKVMTFAGGTANDPGDYDGTGNPATLFTVTGTVILRLLAVGETNLAGAGATLEIGIAGNTAKIIAQSTATDIDANDIWHDASPDSGIEATSVLAENIVANGQDAVQTVATANITAGKIRYIALWYPLSEDGDVTPA